MTCSRRDFLLSSLAVAALRGESVAALAAGSERENILWYGSEAQRWGEALPIGNGRIGGMVYGGARRERIALTESTVWSGAPGATDMNPGGREHLTEIRQLLFEGNYARARELCEKHVLSHPANFGTNLPLMDLALEFQQPEPVTAYRRWLDLDEGIASAAYRAGAALCTRECFSSNPDGVLVAHFESESQGLLQADISLGEIAIPGGVLQLSDDTLAFHGDAFEIMHSDGKHGVHVECRVRALHRGGTVSAGGDRLKIRNASAITLLVAIATSYRGADPRKACEAALEAVSSKTYTELRRRHIADHQLLFRRVKLNLGKHTEAASLPSDLRRRNLDEASGDPELCALFFQYGRYLTIAGSRENSPLPLALQGIWNDGLASSMGWTDDFHLDINTQQNYWLAEVGNLGESQTPLFGLIDGMRASGRETAQQLYGAPGWVSHVVTNAWGYTAPGWGLGWGIFVTSGIWLALQMWEHYRFTCNERFLREHAYPVFKEAAEFFLAYMVQEPKHGWLVTGPSDSPENSFRSPNGDYCNESMGPTVDRVLVYALFGICLDAEKTLSLDPGFAARLRLAREKLPPLQIGRYGQLQEWLEDFEEAEPNHRHTSHLIALYPENQISPEATPALAQAVRVTLTRRIRSPKWEDTEWSRANLVNYYARLWSGDDAYRHLIGLLAKATGDNLLTYSRGGVAAAEANIFAIDGNTAGAAGIAEMLLQSQGHSIHLLPALPAAWPEGFVSGLCARGGFQVEMRWRAHMLTSASISSARGGNCTVRYGASRIPVHVEPGRSVRLTTASFQANAGLQNFTEMSAS